MKKLNAKIVKIQFYENIDITDSSTSHWMLKARKWNK